MQNTPASERTFISFFGAVNAGKSSVINLVANQPVSIVSEQPGTTTDPVTKSMELLPIGPVILCDTAGLGDGTALGTLPSDNGSCLTQADMESSDIRIRNALLLLKPTVSCILSSAMFPPVRTNLPERPHSFPSAAFF